MKAVLKTAEGAKKGNEFRLYWKQQKVPRRGMKAVLKTAKGAKKGNEGCTENSRRCQEGKWRLYWKQQKVPRRKMKALLKTAEGAKKENEGSTENSRRCQEGKWRLYWKQQKVPRRKMKVIPCHRWWSKVSETHIWLVIVFVLRWVVSGEVLVGTKIPDWGGRGRLYLMLRCEHQSDSLLRWWSSGSHFNVSLIVGGRVTRKTVSMHHSFWKEESWNRNRGSPAYQPNALITARPAWLTLLAHRLGLVFLLTLILVVPFSLLPLSSRICQVLIVLSSLTKFIFLIFIKH